MRVQRQTRDCPSSQGIYHLVDYDLYASIWTTGQVVWVPNRQCKGSAPGELRRWCSFWLMKLQGFPQNEVFKFGLKGWEGFWRGKGVLGWDNQTCSWIIQTMPNSFPRSIIFLGCLGDNYYFQRMWCLIRVIVILLYKTVVTCKTHKCPRTSKPVWYQWSCQEATMIVQLVTHSQSMW